MGAGAGVAVALGAGSRSAAVAPGVEVAPGLDIHPRSEWDTGKKATRPIPPEPDVRFLLVHHAASSNQEPQSAIPARLRAAYVLHTGPQKRWPDVCYNFFVDPFGGVWEGRTGSLAGPVMADATGGSQGFAQLVCLLGNFQHRMPTPEALDALTRTLAWLADRYRIDTTPGATTQFISRGSNKWKKGAPVTASTISGHRDMTYTACPGDAFYPYVHTRLQSDVDQRRTG